ncbi:hypothetical protein LEN26_007032 [Aphanomyces euteiches]|nr:hypothetical protein AeMF1_015737 [Aphanomyces euteiches]KAH9133743.1 hypothetical protein LEN26_007032 [Aphanomyces euteiches]KAH9197278.1 hypothetical protein AeNC1_000760 [Aphanomyces euteiches]
MSWQDLGRDSFRCPPLSESARRGLIDEAKLACKYLVVTATTSDAIPIDSVIMNTKTKRHASIRMIKDKMDLSLGGSHVYTRIRTTIDAVSDFFYLDTPNKVQDYSRVMGETIINKVTLYTLVERPVSEASSQPLHYVGVEWVLNKPKASPPRDWCYLSYHDEFCFVDEGSGEQRKGWVACMHSVDLSCCPSMEKRYGINRGTFIRSGHVFLETAEPGVLDYIKVSLIKFGGSVLKHCPQFYLKSLVKTYGSIALNLEEHFILRRLRPLLDLPVTRFQQKKDVDYCNQCLARFSWITLKKQCRACGDIVCQKCSSKWPLQFYVHKIVKVALCENCISGAQKQPQEPAAHMLTATSTMELSPTTSRPRKTYLAGDQEERSFHQTKPLEPAHARPPSYSYDESEMYDKVGPSIITLGASPPDAPVDDDEMTIHFLSPSQWRESSVTNASAQDVRLTLQSDSSSIYL